MKRACLAAALLATLAAFPVFAQAPIEKEPSATTSTVNLTLEQRHIIRELVREVKTPNASVASKLSAGDAVPNGIEAQPMPALVASKVPQVRSHRFFVTQQQIAIVDPQENKVVEVIE